MLSGRKPQAPIRAKTATKAASLLLAVFAFLGLAVAVHAQGITANEVLPPSFGQALGLGSGDIRITIAALLRVVFGLLGLVAVVLIMYAGFLWMTARGDEEQIGRAKATMTSAIIGLVIILTAFGITSFIINALLGASQQGGPGGGGSGGASDEACIGLSTTCPAGALGNGIVESHYPGRNATGVPRNTRVVVTFKSAIDPKSLVVGGEGATIAILKSSQVASGGAFPLRFTQSLTAAAIDVVPTPDNKTFAFIQKNCPTDCFGSASENVFYTVALRGGSDGVKKADGTAAFSGAFSSGYLWEFQVSTVLDLTPPKVSAVEPADGDKDVARNSLVQVSFDEAVDPISLTAGFALSKSGGTAIAGVQAIGNAYRTMEFRTNDQCGTNSCGEQVYCLPSSQALTATVRADGLTDKPPTGIFPPNGVTDMAGNSLDGNADGKAGDDYRFAFTTGSEIDLVPPKVVSETPDAASAPVGNVARDLPITVTFSKIMSQTSMTSDSVRLVPGAGGAPTNFEVTSDKTVGTIRHDLMSVDQPYAASLTSALRDLHQNCFYPGGGQTLCTGKEAYCCNGKPSNTACGFLP